MKRYILGIVVLAGFAFTACTKHFDTVYSDPEALKNTAAGYFLDEILFDGANAGLHQSLSLNNELTQMTVSVSTGKLLHRYIFRTSDYDYTWQNYYTTLNNVKDMRMAARRDKFVNCEAISLIMWGWLYENLTDTYGDIPYDDALQGYPNYQLRNQFDKQEYIYQDLVNKLDTANNMILANSIMEGGHDLMYHAHDTTGVGYRMIRWKKLANTLRLRLLMRVAAKSPEARAQINLIYSNPTKYPLMASNDETAVVRYGNDPINNPFFISPYANVRDLDWNGSRGISNFVLDSLVFWNDPRLPKWFTTVAGSYTGLPSGFSSFQLDSIAAIDGSTLTLDLKASPLTGLIMQYAEEEFIKAEAILRGYISGDAKTAYENGVKASLGYWGVSVPADFLTRPGIAYDGSLRQVLQQKYYALFFNDTQQWFEINRTGYPVLPKGPATMGKMLPTRLPYPLLVQTSNAANFQDAVTHMGGNTDTTKLWWQP